jgi:hypothetical protein
MIDNVVVGLQHHLDSLKAERSLSTEACPTSYNNKVIALKVVDITNAEQVGSPAMKGEPQVSCVHIIIINTGHRHSELCGIGMSDSSST